MLKINGLNGDVKLIIQERDFMTDTLTWVAAMEQEIIKESDADTYIQRALQRDPDLWVIEIEDKDMQNPFEES